MASLGAAAMLFVALSSPTRAADSGATLPVVGSIGGSGSQAIAVEGTRAYLGLGMNVLVIDISDPLSPRRVGELALPDAPRSIVAAGDRIYVADGVGGLRIIDVTRPDRPALLEAFEECGAVEDVDVAKNMAYVACGPDGLWIVHVRDAFAPRAIGQVTIAGNVTAVDVSGDRAYLAAGVVGLVILDVSDPRFPRTQRSISFLHRALDVVAEGEHAYVLADRATGGYGTGPRSGILIVDVSVPASAHLVGWIQDPFGPGRLVEVGGVLYVANKGLHIVDATDRRSPRALPIVQTGHSPTDVALLRGYAFTANAGGGMAVFAIEPDGSARDVGRYAPALGSKVSGLVVSGSLGYIAGDRSLRIVDLRDPRRPRDIATAPLPGVGMMLAVTGAYVFVVGRAPLRLWTLDAADPQAVRLLDTLRLSPEGASIEAIALVDTMLYLATGSGGLQLVDVADPARPRLAGAIPGLNDAYDVVMRDGRAYVASADGLHIFDTLNPRLPVPLGQVLLDGAAAVDVRDGLAVVAVEEGVWTVDVGDPAAPLVLGHVSRPRSVSSVRLRGDIALLAGSGLTVLDVSHPSLPREITWSGLADSSSRISSLDDVVYVNIGDVVLIDIADPTRPHQLGSLYLGDVFWHATSVTVEGSIAYVLTGNSGHDVLRLVDVSNGSQPRQVGGIAEESGIDDVSVVGTMAYLAIGWNGLVIYDVSDPHSPRRLGGVETSGGASSVTVDDGRAYVVSMIYEDDWALDIVDVADPHRPEVIGSHGLARRYPNMAQHVGGLIYMAIEWDLMVLDASNPTVLLQLAKLSMTDRLQSLAVAGAFCYVAADDADLQVVDISDPRAPHIVARLASLGAARHVAVMRGKVYLAEGRSGTHYYGGGMRVIDVSDPYQPREIAAETRVIPAGPIAVSGTTAYVAGGDDGLVLFALPLEIAAVRGEHPVYLPSAVRSREP